MKNKPGIHLFKDSIAYNNKKTGRFAGYKTQYFWHIASKNGRIIAKSEMYNTKKAAVRGIKITGQAFCYVCNVSWASYYDHSKPNSPLQPYL